jgi:adenosine deaminase
MNKHPYGDDLKLPMRPYDREFFKKLPKTDLHVHLDGSLRISTILNLDPQSILDLVINGVKSAFIPYEYKKWFLRDTKKKAIDLINSYA